MAVGNDDHTAAYARPAVERVQIQTSIDLPLAYLDRQRAGTDGGLVGICETSAHQRVRSHQRVDTKGVSARQGSGRRIRGQDVFVGAESAERLEEGWAVEE